MPRLGIDLFSNRKNTFLCIKELCMKNFFYLEIKEELKLE